MQKLIQKAYDEAAHAYLRERHQLRSDTYVRKLLKLLRTGSTILDVGCGAGEPVDTLLLKAGHFVTGIDLSPIMIAKARVACPAGQYDVRDLLTLIPGEYAVDAIVSFYTLFHVPREHHKTIIATLMSYLPHGGHMLITLGDKEFEGFTHFYGQKMWWSQWGPEKNRDIIKRVGMEILFDSIDHSGAENHHIVLAVKP